MPRNQDEPYPLSGPEFFEDPYPVYHRMRRRDPVYWSEALGAWVMTRHDDVLAALRNPALSNDRTEASDPPQPRDGGPAPAADFARIFSSTMIMKDGPDHLIGSAPWPPRPSRPRHWDAGCRGSIARSMS